MPKFAGTSGRSTKAPKIQGTGGGSTSFVRQPAIVGELVIVTPVEEKLGVWNEGKPDERKTRQLTADVVVLTGPHAGNYPGMFLSGRPIIDKGVEILEDEEDTPVAERTVLAGRMIRKPLKKYKDAWPTPEALEAAIADPKVVVPNNAYSWLIPDPSEADMALIMAYYQGGQAEPSANDEGSDDGDPFED
jgi:hypothetical protein